MFIIFEETVSKNNTKYLVVSINLEKDKLYKHYQNHYFGIATKMSGTSKKYYIPTLNDCIAKSSGLKHLDYVYDYSIDISNYTANEIEQLKKELIQGIERLNKENKEFYQRYVKPVKLSGMFQVDFKKNKIKLLKKDKSKTSKKRSKQLKKESK